MCPSMDMAGREALKECSYQLLSHPFCISRYMVIFLYLGIWERSLHKSWVLGLQSKPVRPAIVVVVLEKDVILLGEREN